MFQLIFKIRNAFRKYPGGGPDKGWGTADQGGSGIIGILVLVVVAGLIWGLWKMFDSGSETANIQDIATKTKGYMGGRNGYDFTSGTTMTGYFIQRGLAPSGMKVVGDKTSGSATLWNTWGGQVVLAPVSSGAGVNTGFSITTNKVPQEDCISFVKQFGTGFFSEISINSTVHSDGEVTSEEGGRECTQDTGSNGNNTLIFTKNG
ncbi:pilus assembly protein PilX [Salmonella enterica subsp. enterica serovar Eastbourne]|uniref:type 4 pilus major pilin n=1 Tax=Kosakonia radicincitans TaxID=283686 RepID=UPI00055ADC5C|nr:type 4 pilus major pilin [Kosakonia radicincitans]EBU5081929.1 pilus assembly protein PilX [Salmonella enterica]EBV2165569.1 pilus assembly protein PilX [Salmonella enterica subsp. enterica serovar Eastbourne]ECC3308692.1 pilus assembly protein PilX [Salmonella enterica subsp. enterica]EEJ9202700.1 pilus assembly protein PilX [Salmonella enterica subsp. enterica serovar Newport]EIE3222495.1 pilus assembly protein PilX [Salmonella enterica subsp. enterica serovar Typhimurium]